MLPNEAVVLFVTSKEAVCRPRSRHLEQGPTGASSRLFAFYCAAGARSTSSPSSCVAFVLPGLSTPGSLPRLRITLLTTTVCCTAIQELAKNKALPTGVCVHDFLQLFFSLFLLSSPTLNFIESAQKQFFPLCFRSCFFGQVGFLQALPPSPWVGCLVWTPAGKELLLFFLRVVQILAHSFLAACFIFPFIISSISGCAGGFLLLSFSSGGCVGAGFEPFVADEELDCETS